jgi:hypothetical protein
MKIEAVRVVHSTRPFLLHVTIIGKKTQAAALSSRTNERMTCRNVQMT